MHPRAQAGNSTHPCTCALRPGTRLQTQESQPARPGAQSNPEEDASLFRRCQVSTLHASSAATGGALRCSAARALATSPPASLSLTAGRRQRASMRRVPCSRASPGSDRSRAPGAQPWLKKPLAYISAQGVGGRRQVEHRGLGLAHELQRVAHALAADARVAEALPGRRRGPGGGSGRQGCSVKPGEQGEGWKERGREQQGLAASCSGVPGG